MKNLKKLILLGTIAVITFSFTSVVKTDWVVPAKYKTMKNPTDANDKENLAIGKTLYAKHCASCHGKKGLGDGSKAPELKGDLGDFSSAEFHKQTDGEIFFRLIDGYEDMPSFKKKIASDEDRWLIVNYVRTLKK
ncbi:MAG: cytochrome C [Flavobacteriales bacterium CG_4_10_14_0_8_um_filter_32_5]|nr:MAG: cytochrome C [Flavobacteriales bacterium CG_4_10_14_0_8_um_filter_32_5]